MQLDTSKLDVKIAPGVQLLTSNRKWELDHPVEADALSPDYIADVARESLNSLLDQGFQRGVALDWSTVRTRLVGSGNDVLLVTEVDVLR